MAGWKWYENAALTQEFPGTLTSFHKTNLSDNPQDFVLYFGNIDDDPGDNQVLMKQEKTSPGDNPIMLSLVDSAPSSGHAADEITLALNAGDLDTNVAGASLDISDFDSARGYHLLSGVSAAVAIHIRIENQQTTPGTSSELSAEMVDTVDLDANEEEPSSGA